MQGITGWSLAHASGWDILIRRSPKKRSGAGRLAFQFESQMMFFVMHEVPDLEWSLHTVTHFPFARNDTI